MSSGDAREELEEERAVVPGGREGVLVQVALADARGVRVRKGDLPR
jgi:hypothetical protein